MELCWNLLLTFDLSAFKDHNLKQVSYVVGHNFLNGHQKQAII